MTPMKNERGFSMIELLLVVAIVTLIAAIAIPNLRKARQSANSASAIQSLRTITTAQQMYRQKYQTYGTLNELAPEGTLDSSLAIGNKSSYLFTVKVTASPLSFTCDATPTEDPLNLAYYFVDDSTVIRYNIGAPADASSPPIPK
jgi:prepilin-type N-terminal cleavage/methylation domain-containing protein